MNELFPFVGGLLAGIVANWLPRRQTKLVWSIAIGSVVGVIATLASGEYRLGWYFVLIDTAIAMGAALSVSIRAQAIADHKPCSLPMTCIHEEKHELDT
jgi:hypothetical protein